jgi:hypothetical protein
VEIIGTTTGNVAEWCTIIAALFGVGAVVTARAKTSIQTRTRNRRSDISMRQIVEGTPARYDSGVKIQEAVPPLSDRLGTLEGSMARLTKIVTPNGGNTAFLGDLIPKIAEKLGIDVPQGDHHED